MEPPEDNGPHGTTRPEPEAGTAPAGAVESDAMPTRGGRQSCRSLTSGTLSRPEPTGPLVPDPPTRSYRSRCQDLVAQLNAGPTKPPEERRAALERAKKHAAIVDEAKPRHKFAAGRLEIAIAAEERMMMALMLGVDQRDQFLQQRDRHFDERHEQRDRHHADRMRGFQLRTETMAKQAPATAVAAVNVNVTLPPPPETVLDTPEDVHAARQLRGRFRAKLAAEGVVPAPPEPPQNGQHNGHV